ncbi:hypothetical protein BJ508DRAFT_64061 [Ascobolus immersus RN42]|uniref:Uncharacterized protein n=1 Tax=Ascobolus immersus RN42 TaxID=1160509 RepID=A0A3N4J1F5_ASCIM|nr:hypothetical protein BJ508DRAFT_64061 [Ascobolus immersus RN42]
MSMRWKELRLVSRSHIRVSWPKTVYGVRRSLSAEADGAASTARHQRFTSRLYSSNECIPRCIALQMALPSSTSIHSHNYDTPENSNSQRASNAKSSREKRQRDKINSTPKWVSIKRRNMCKCRMKQIRTNNRTPFKSH